MPERWAINEELYVQTVLFVIFTGSPNPAIVPRVSIRAFTKNFDHRLWASDDHWCSKVHHRPKTFSSTLVLVVQIGSLLTNYPLLRISNKSLVPLQLVTKSNWRSFCSSSNCFVYVDPSIWANNLIIAKKNSTYY